MVTYPGTGNFSSFTYDGLGNRVKIVETRNNSVTSTLQFVFCGNELCESRDNSGALVSQFFALGETTSGTTNKYYFGLDQLGSVRTVTDSNGNDVAEISYDAFGRQTVLSGSFSPDFGYAGMYQHQPSGLNLTLMRPYSPTLGRWLSRDPLAEQMGTNDYIYAGNNPVSNRDPQGLCFQAILAGMGPLGWAGLGLVTVATAGWWISQHPVQWPTLPVDCMCKSKPVGRAGNPLQVPGNPPQNPPVTINGIDYSGHAQDQMQGRGIPPSAVEQAIKEGEACPGDKGRTQHYDPDNNLTAVTEPNGEVVTVHPGPPTGASP